MHDEANPLSRRAVCDVLREGMDARHTRLLEGNESSRPDCLSVQAIERRDDRRLAPHFHRSDDCDGVARSPAAGQLAATHGLAGTLGLRGELEPGPLIVHGQARIDLRIDLENGPHVGVDSELVPPAGSRLYEDIVVTHKQLRDLDSPQTAHLPIHEDHRVSIVRTYYQPT